MVELDGTTHDCPSKISLLQVPSTLIHNCRKLPARVVCLGDFSYRRIAFAAAWYELSIFLGSKHTHTYITHLHQWNSSPALFPFQSRQQIGRLVQRINVFYLATEGAGDLLFCLALVLLIILGICFAEFTVWLDTVVLKGGMCAVFFIFTTSSYFSFQDLVTFGFHLLVVLLLIIVPSNSAVWAGRLQHTG